DSFAGMALILAGLARRGGTLGDWQGSFRPSAIEKQKVECSASDAQPVMMALREEYAAEQLDLTEGLRVIWQDGSWLHARPSNTEPIIRVVAEADERAQAQEKCARAIGIIRSRLGG
ncbi:MAG: phosphoglucosamine mutase, partial [Armatimonadia bacterium]